MVEEDTWKPRENLGNMEELVKEFKEEYSEIGRVKTRRNNKEDRREELPGIWQKYCIDGITRNLMKNIRDNWKEIGENEREKERKD